MTRYLIFAGLITRPTGGWGDLLAHSHDRADAVDVAKKMLELGQHYWAHVVDLDTSEIVWTGESA